MRSVSTSPRRGTKGSSRMEMLSTKKIGLHFMPFMTVGLVCLFSYLFLDKPIAYYCRSINENVIDVFGLITKLGESTWYLIITALFFVIFRFIMVNINIANRSLFVFLAISLSGLLTDILKYILARYRPISLFYDGAYGFSFFESQYRMTSFPSGHANTITALMLALYFMYPKYRMVCILAAVLVIASRVVLCDHFLSDVLFGAYLAVVTTFYLRHCFMRRNIQIFALKKPDDPAASSLLVA
jgi:membrane-associated phospholipid phosphatase